MLSDVPSRLRFYASSKALTEGRRLHLQLTRNGYDCQTFIGNLLVNMYGQCGSLQDACGAFEKIQQRNVFSWNILITAFSQNGRLQNARDAFERMPSRNLVSCNALLKCLVQNAATREARELLESIPDPDTMSWNILLAAYAQEGDLQRAEELYAKISYPDTVTFNTMISAYTLRGYLQEATSFFEVTTSRDFVSWNTVLSALTREGEFVQAKNMFEKIPQRDAWSWTDMFQSYAQHGHIREAKALFDEMPKRDVISWTGMLTSFALNQDIEQATEVFDRMPERDQVSCTAMLTEHAENGDLTRAREVFDSTHPEDSVAWTAMISAYAKNGEHRQALELFRRMDIEGQPPDPVTVLTMLEVCASLPALREGRLLHQEIIERGLEADVAMSTAIFNMYAKCGSLERAKELFEGMQRRDLVSWNALIAAHSQNGDFVTALSVFQLMVLDGVQPSDSSFVSLLSAFSHTGLVKDARELFVSMSGSFHVAPTFDLYMIMVDILGRAGQLKLAESLARSMPFEADTASLRVLLGSCRVHGDGSRGSWFAEQLDFEDPALFILLSNLFCHHI